ncbi:MAG: dethiobiotin synthase [Hyphomonadaceae bacterium]|nr:dethiobiotin synthase [Hyphomonadaceae bacterium]
MNACFVTAIGTEIGKTYVSSRLIEAWRGESLSVLGLKPVMSGFGEADLAESDAGHLLTACGETVTPQAVGRICRHRFEAPLAPNVAMRQAGLVQDYEGILSFTRQAIAESNCDRVLVEGAGGVMSPLTDDHLQIDFMADLGLPVILVAAPYLGAVSHTLTAIDALRARGLELVELVISQPDPSSPKPESLGAEVDLFRSVAWRVAPHLAPVYRTERDL